MRTRIPLAVVVLSGFLAMGCIPAKAAGNHETAPTSATTTHTKVAAAIHHAVEAGFYNPRELFSPRWEIFWSTLDHLAATPRTNRNFALHVIIAMNRVGVTHFDLMRPERFKELQAYKKSASTEGGKHVTLTFGKQGIAVLTVHGEYLVSNTLKPLTRAFGTIAKKQPKALIIDMRDNPGGDLSAMLLVGHLVSKPTVAGLFLSRKWYEKHAHAPSRKQWKTLPHLAKPDLKAFRAALAKTGAVVGVVPPMKPRYNGPVYILTSAVTASACEPVVYLLQHIDRATVVGRHTAGFMLSSRTVPLPGGWHLQFPVADYYTPQMTRIDQVGITPNVVVPAQQALKKARQLALQAK